MPTVWQAGSVEKKRDRPEVPAVMVRRIRRVLSALPECHEEPAWVGTRWQVGHSSRGATVAHVVGLVLDDDTDWDELAELLTDSYCVQAPRALAERVPRPSDRPG